MRMRIFGLYMNDTHISEHTPLDTSPPFSYSLKYLNEGKNEGNR